MAAGRRFRASPLTRCEAYAAALRYVLDVHDHQSDGQAAVDALALPREVVPALAVLVWITMCGAIDPRGVLDGAEQDARVRQALEAELVGAEMEAVVERAAVEDDPA
jgi:hypothetical protein